LISRRYADLFSSLLSLMPMIAIIISLIIFDCRIISPASQPLI